MVHSADISPEKLIELVNQLFNISKAESIPLDQMSDFVKQKIEEKKKIEEELREADTLLQNKNVRLQAIDEHLKLKEQLDRHGVSMQYIDKLLKLFSNAKRYGFDGKEIADKAV
jgi:translation initiation factor IF-3